MDPHKAIRGARLKAWIAKHGGAAHCLTGAGFERGTKEFKSLESFLSTCNSKGMGHAAADAWEKRLEVLGMPAGTLTNNLEDPALPEPAAAPPVAAEKSKEPAAPRGDGQRIPLAQLVAELAVTLDQMSREGREIAGQALLTLCRAPDSRKAALDVVDALTSDYADQSPSGQFRKQSGA